MPRATILSRVCVHVHVCACIELVQDAKNSNLVQEVRGHAGVQSLLKEFPHTEYSFARFLFKNT